MNQAFIINDDYLFDKSKGIWCCTAMLSGNKITIYIQSNVAEKELSQDIKFDWECVLEEWLELNEPDNNDQILININ